MSAIARYQWRTPTEVRHGRTTTTLTQCRRHHRRSGARGGASFGRGGTVRPDSADSGGAGRHRGGLGQVIELGGVGGAPFDVLAMFDQGRLLPATDYVNAQRLRRLFQREFAKVFDQCDVLLTPTAPGPAFGIAEKTDDPIAMYLNDVFTVTVNLAGLPGISVPAGLNGEGLPLGLQLIGKAFDEATLFRAGEVIEKAAGLTPRPQAWSAISATRPGHRPRATPLRCRGRRSSAPPWRETRWCL